MDTKKTKEDFEKIIQDAQEGIKRLEEKKSPKVYEIFQAGSHVAVILPSPRKFGQFVFVVLNSIPWISTGDYATVEHAVRVFHGYDIKVLGKTVNKIEVN